MTPKSLTHRFVANLRSLAGLHLSIIFLFGLNNLASAQDAETSESSEPAESPAVDTEAPAPEAEVAADAEVKTLDTINVESTAAPEPAPRPAPRPVPAPAPVPVPAPVVEPAPEIEPLVIDDQVNALKTGTPLVDIPRSITIFQEERIEDQGIINISEIVDYTPGVTNTQGEGHRDAVVFRGVRSTADFYIDGLRDDVQYYRSLYNVEQVEILRGASALHFGRGGTGGILNRSLKRPVIGETFGEYGVTVDTFGATYEEFDYNMPLFFRDGYGEGKGGKMVYQEPWAAARINVFHEYLSNHRDFYDGNRYGVNPTVAFELGPDTRLDLSYEFNDHERFIDRGIPTGLNGRPVRSLVDTVFGDPDLNTATFRSHTFRADLNHKFNDNWKGRLTGFYGDYEKSYQNFYASGYDQVRNLVTLDGYQDNTVRTNMIFSGDLIGEFDTGAIGHTVILGAEYVQTSSDQNRFNTFWNTTRDDNEVFNASNFRLNWGSGINAAGVRATNNFNADLADDTRVDIDAHSFYMQDEIAMTEWLDVVLGARYDAFYIDVFNPVNGERRTRRDEDVTPRLGVILKPIEELSFYGSYSESFLPRSGEQFANINGTTNALDPNTYSNLEAGVNWNIQPDLALRLSIFEAEESSPQVADADPSTLEVVDTKTTGFEAQLTGQITDNWYIAPGYSYLDGEQVDRMGSTGLRPRELPEHTFSIWNKFQLTEKTGFGLGVVYQDESFIDNANTAVLPSYTRVDAAVYHQLCDRLRLQVNIENLFDTEYFPSSHSTHQVTVGRPINASFSIRGTF